VWGLVGGGGLGVGCPFHYFNKILLSLPILFLAFYFFLHFFLISLDLWLVWGAGVWFFVSLGVLGGVWGGWAVVGGAGGGGGGGGGWGGGGGGGGGWGGVGGGGEGWRNERGKKAGRATWEVK